MIDGSGRGLPVINLMGLAGGGFKLIVHGLFSVYEIGGRNDSAKIVERFGYFTPVSLDVSGSGGG